MTLLAHDGRAWEVDGRAQALVGLGLATPLRIQSVDHGYPTDVIYFDFCIIFDTVSHARLLLKLEFSNLILIQSYVLELT